jgi:hypothetical protein
MCLEKIKKNEGTYEHCKRLLVAYLPLEIRNPLKRRRVSIENTENMFATNMFLVAPAIKRKREDDI